MTDVNKLRDELRKRFDVSTTQVPLVGGPLDGRCEELEYGWPVPSMMRLPDDAGELHEYLVIDGVGHHRPR
jgi:hypothetical protein